jgi:hypothetical protein
VGSVSGISKGLLFWIDQARCQDNRWHSLTPIDSGESLWRSEIGMVANLLAEHSGEALAQQVADQDFFPTACLSLSGWLETVGIAHAQFTAGLVCSAIV